MPSAHADVCDLNRGWVGHLASFGLLARGAAVVLAVWGVLLWTLTLAGMMPRGAQVIYPRLPSARRGLRHAGPPAPGLDVRRTKVLRDAKSSTHTGRAAALNVYFQFLELRHKIDLHNMTGRVVECPLDEINRPRASVDPQLRIPPTADEVEQLFAGWRDELVTCRKFAPAARNYAVAWPPTWDCASTKRGCSTWTTCGGNWGGSAS